MIHILWFYLLEDHVKSVEPHSAKHAKKRNKWNHKDDDKSNDDCY